jgi:hypothetical protein
VVPSATGVLEVSEEALERGPVLVLARLYGVGVLVNDGVVMPTCERSEFSTLGVD